MSAPSSPPPAWRRRVLWLIALVLAIDLAFAWQRLEGVYRSEFGGHPEEARHVLTGLFVRDAVVFGRDWLLQGAYGSAIEAGREYAETYSASYPNIAPGVWPPLFHLVQAAWTLPVPPSRTSLLVLMAALAGGVALLLAGALREEYGRAIATGAAVLLLSLPLVRQSSGVVMPEILSGLLMFGAMLAFGRFLDCGERASVLWFGTLAALAILTQESGLALVLAAPLAILGTRQFQRLGSPALWGAVLIIVASGGSWMWLSWRAGSPGWLPPSWSWNVPREALPFYGSEFGRALGWVILPLMILGLLVKVHRPGSQRGRWMAAGALLVSVVVFQSCVPTHLEARHLIPAIPPALMFAAAGAHWLGARLGGRWWVMVIGVLGFASIARPLTSKGYTGFAPIVVEAMREAGPAEITLISSDATGEGILIAEMALRERRPGHLLRRASQDLARHTPGGGDQPVFARDEDLLAFLLAGNDTAYRYLVLDDALPKNARRGHHDQLQRLVEEYPQSFELLASSEITRAGVPQATPIQLYKIHRKN